MPWAPDYAGPAELGTYMRIGDSEDFAELALAVTAASRAVDRATNRQFGVVGSAQERTYDGRWDRHRAKYVIEHDDLMTTTGFLVEDGTGLLIAAADYTLEPRNGPQTGRPWTQVVVPTLTNPAVLTGNWGWTSVPTVIKQATLIQGSRFFTRRSAPFGVAGSPDLGSELRLLAKVDPDVEVMLGAFRRWWSAA